MGHAAYVIEVCGACYANDRSVGGTWCVSDRSVWGMLLM